MSIFFFFQSLQRRLSIIALYLTLNSLGFAQESVILRTDRDIYIGGEAIWYQLNCLNSQSNDVTDLSKVIYLELINERNTPVYQTKCHLNNGHFQSHFQIPDSLSTGNYLLRAYSRWMRNYPTQHFGTKIISIINPFVEHALPKSDKLFSMDTIICYPEGNNFLAGINNKIVIRSIDQYGRIKPLKGLIKTSSLDTISSFVTNEKGFATINIKPELNKSYYIPIKKGDQTHKLYLPSPMHEGIKLTLNTSNNNSLTLEVLSTFTKQTNNLYIEITRLDGDLIKKIPVVDGDILNLLHDAYPKGVLIAQLFSKKGILLATRPFMINSNDNGSAIKLSLNKKNIGTREKVDLTISPNLPHQNLKHVSISIAKSCLVHNRDSIYWNRNENSSIKQTINNWQSNKVPFNDLLLTIDQTSSIKSIESSVRLLPEPRGEIISGTITNTITNKPIADEKIVLSFVGNSATMQFSRTDSLGRFRFIINQYGEKEMVIQPFTNDTTKLNYKVNLLPSFSNSYGNNQIPVFTLDANRAKQINSAIINMQVNAIYKPYLQSSMQNHITESTFFYGIPEHRVVIDHFIELPNIEEIVNELVPFSFVRRKKGQREFKVHEDLSLYPKSGETLAFVDGVPIFDVDRVLQINPLELNRIELINLDYYFEDEKLGRMLFFFTKTANMEAMEFDHRIFRQALKCYAYGYHFNAPQYNTKVSEPGRIPDLRNVLLYESFNCIDEKGKTISFYTSDESTEYIIAVESIGKDGQIERVELPLTVQE